MMLLEPGRSLLVVLPTGVGKSLVAQAPALLNAEEGATTIMVVPTVALAIDQERRAREMFLGQWRGASPSKFAYHSGLDLDEKQALRQRITEGRQPLVIASPEAVVQGLRPSLLSCARKGSLRAIVVDEAHLVSQWGNEFRPDFQALAGVRHLLVKESPRGSEPRTVLLTATLSQDTWTTLNTLFGTPDLDTVASVHLRPEPSCWLARAPDTATRDLWLHEIVRFAPRPLILYTAVREDADRWHNLLHASGIRRLGRLHGGTSAQERELLLSAWAAAETDIMVATSAFGLGVDQADVRTIIHACVPETLDRYYQEVGRGGRDGRACLSIMVHAPNDMAIAQSLNRERIIGIEKGLPRWRQMFDGAVSSPDDERLFVSLDARPPHVQADSDANVAWNLRTLILMARAGLLELDAVEPTLLAQQVGETEVEFAERQRDAFEQYSLRVAVRPTGQDHLSEEIWNTQVTPARQKTLISDRRSLEQIELLLEGKERLCSLLVESYTVEAGVICIKPQPVDGNCPASRALGIRHGSYIVPEPSLAVRVSSPIGLRLAALAHAGGRCLLVSIPALGGSRSQKWRENLIPALRKFVAHGVREIRAAADWLELAGYRELYRYARPRIVFHTDLGGAAPDLSSALPVPRLSIAESRTGLTDLLADGNSSGRPLEILLVPEDSPDPDLPYRTFLAVRAHMSLAHVMMELD